MNTHALNLTRDAIIRALATKSRPLLLHDVLELKRMRGDGDCDLFLAVTREFGSGLNATCGGALEAMKQWTRKGLLPRTPAVVAFMADLTAIETGKFSQIVRGATL